jgi:hypothetical protein
MIGLIVMAGAVAVFVESVTDVAVTLAVHCTAGATGGVYVAAIPLAETVPQPLAGSTLQVTPFAAPSLVIVATSEILPWSANSVEAVVGALIANRICLSVNVMLVFWFELMVEPAVIVAVQSLD